MLYNFCLGESSLNHRWREEFSAISSYTGEVRIKKLSSLVDKSGNFGEVKERLAYYLATFFHIQDNIFDI